MRTRTVLASDAGDAARAEKPGRPRRARAACERTDLVIVGVCGFSGKLVRVYRRAERRGVRYGAEGRVLSGGSHYRWDAAESLKT